MARQTCRCCLLRFGRLFKLRMTSANTMQCYLTTPLGHTGVMNNTRWEMLASTGSFTKRGNSIAWGWHFRRLDIIRKLSIGYSNMASQTQYKGPIHTGDMIAYFGNVSKWPAAERRVHSVMLLLCHILCFNQFDCGIIIIKYSRHFWSHFKHLEVRQKYPVTLVWKCGQTQSFVFDIFHENNMFQRRKRIFANYFHVCYKLACFY